MVMPATSQYRWTKSKGRFTTGLVINMFTNEQMAFIALGSAWAGAALGMVVTCLCSAKKCADCRNYYSRWTEISYQSPPPPQYPPKPPKRGGDDVGVHADTVAFALGTGLGDFHEGACPGVAAFAHRALFITTHLQRDAEFAQGMDGGINRAVADAGQFMGFAIHLKREAYSLRRASRSRAESNII